MPVLANHTIAKLEIEKFEDYCLSASHPRGRHKARVFAESLGVSQADATWLRQAILAGLSQNEAMAQDSDVFGQRWRVDMLLTRQSRTAVVRTLWIVLQGDFTPRFVTCWVL